MANIPTLTQDLRDEVIADIQGLNIPGLSASSVRKLGAFPQVEAAVLVGVDDEAVAQNVADNIRLMVVSIHVATYAPQDREGDRLDEVSSYIERYVREPRQFNDHAGFRQVRLSQMIGQTRRADSYGEQAWFVCSFEMVLPYANASFPLPPEPSPSPSPSPSI